MPYDYKVPASPQTNDISLREARWIALAAQGFDEPRPSRRVTARDIERTILRLGLVQIDYANVVLPAKCLGTFLAPGFYSATSWWRASI